MLKKIPSNKINGTKNALFFLLRAPIHHSFTFDSWFWYQLKHKVRFSKTVCGIFHFRFCFVFKVYIFVLQNAWTLLTFEHHNSFQNYHGTAISVIWLVERSAIKLLISIRYYRKTNFEVLRNFNVTLHWWQFSGRFRSLFFEAKKRRQCSKVTTIPWDLL